MHADAQKLAAELLAELCAEKVRAGSAGVFAEELPQISAKVFLSRIFEAIRDPAPRAALLGGAKLQAPRGAVVSFDPQEANQWRNDPDSSAPSIILVLGPASRLNSLRTAFPNLGTRDLRGRAVARAIELRDTPERRALWERIGEMPAEIPIKKLLEALAHLIGLSPAALLDGEIKALARLGLLPTPRLLQQGGPSAARAELRRNLDTIHKLRELSERDHGLISDMAESGGADERRDAAAILRFYSTGRDQDLAALTLESVQAALKWRPRRARPDDDIDEDPEPFEPEREADVLAASSIIFGGGEVGAELAEKIEDELQRPAHDGEPSSVPFSGGKVHPRPRAGSSEMQGLFAAISSPSGWGGVVVGGEALPLKEALRRVAEGTLEAERFEPEADDGLVWTLRRAVKQGLAEPAVLESWSAYAAAREVLLPSIDRLVDRPVFAIWADPGLARAIDAVIAAYGAALDAIAKVAEELARRGSHPRAQKLYAQAVSLDIAFILTEGDARAIMSPLHPFHLWRCAALLEILRSCREDLEALGEKEVERLIEDAPLSAPNLLLSPLVTPRVDVPTYFMPTASVGAVPLYVEPTARSLGRYKSRALAKIAERYLRLAPHASFGLQVALVDPPSIVGVLEELSKLQSTLQKDVPLHVRVLRTRGSSDETESDQERAILIAGQLRDTGGSLAAEERCNDLDAVAERLRERPAHITAVFEPGEAKTIQMSVTAPPVLSPLSLPRTYRYDAFEDRIDVVVAGEIEPLSRFHEFYCRILGVPTTDFVGRRSGVNLHARALERIARATIWLTVIDQGVEPTIRLDGAQRIDQRSDAGRDVVTFTAFAETIEDLVADVARQAGLPTDLETVRRLQEQLFRISGEATLMLSTGSQGLNLVNPRLAAAIVGVAAAARWYERLHPEALLISIDDDSSRRWILGHNHDGRRADILGVRKTPDGVFIDVMEVKTHEVGDGGLTAAEGRVEGKAAAQIDQTVKILRDLLDPSRTSPVLRARTDVLRDQLYRAVASRPYDPLRRGQLVYMLDELFSSGAGGVNGLIFIVRITPTASGVGPSSPRYYKTAGDNSVGIVELDEGGARREARATATALTSGAPGSASKLPGQSGRERAAAPTASSGSRLAVYVGETYTGEEVRWDPHHPERPLNNFGLLVTGDSGAGKTQIIRAIIAETAPSALPVCVLDFKNDFSAPDFCAQVKLESHDVNRRGLPFNPLSLIPDERGECQPIRQAHEIAGILRRVFKLGDQQETRLKDAIVGAYEQMGISTKEWLRVAAADPAPGFDEVLRILRRDKKNDALLNRLSKLSDLNLLPQDADAMSSFDRLLSSRVALDLHGLPDETTKEAIAEFIIVRLHSFVLRGEQPRQLRRLLVLDEAWRVKDSERLQELAREGRAFGVGVVIGTQFPEDIPDTLSGNLATRLYLYNQNDDHRRAVLRALCGSTSSEAARDYSAKLQALQKHEGFFHNQQHTPAVLVKTLPHYQRVRGATKG